MNKARERFDNIWLKTTKGEKTKRSYLNEGMIRIFIFFLCHKGVLIEYITNAETQNGCNTRELLDRDVAITITPYHLFLYVFEWKFTKEGHKFWKRFHDIFSDSKIHNFLQKQKNNCRNPWKIKKLFVSLQRQIENEIEPNF